VLHVRPRQALLLLNFVLFFLLAELFDHIGVDLAGAAHIVGASLHIISLRRRLASHHRCAVKPLQLVELIVLLGRRLIHRFVSLVFRLLVIVDRIIRLITVAFLALFSHGPVKIAKVVIEFLGEVLIHFLCVLGEHLEALDFLRELLLPFLKLIILAL